MRFFLASLVLVIAVAGCTTESQARREAQQAFLQGQQTAAARQPPGVTIIGPVKNPNVPWVAGLTLAQAIATATYIGLADPKEIIITRQGETATIDAKTLLNGKDIPLEIGDVIELR
jgi:protein involved in polysaccharide export with SLBB domain